MGGGTSLPPVSAGSLSRMEAIAHGFSERAKGAQITVAVARLRGGATEAGEGGSHVRFAGSDGETAMQEADTQTDMEREVPESPTSKIARLEAALAESQLESAGLRLSGVSLRTLKPDSVKPTRFSGKSSDGAMDIRTWFAMMEEYCAYTKVPEDERAACVSLYLDGKARVMYHARVQSAKLLVPEFKPTMTWLKDLLLSAYGSVDPISEAWTKLKRLRQGSSSVEDYAQSFEQLCCELREESPSEAAKIQMFMDGLNSEVRFRCACMPDGSRWTSFAPLLKCCSLNWAVMQQTRKDLNSGSGSGPSRVTEDKQSKPKTNALSLCKALCLRRSSATTST